jgi:tripartite-type tricarboxylate transporter receptor subunit TctC
MLRVRGYRETNPVSGAILKTTPSSGTRVLSRRAAVAFGCALLAHVLCASAQTDYPVKPVRLVAGFAPGGITDVLARTVAERLSASFGRQVIVENRPGAGTQIACELVAKSPADGYTLLFQDVTTHAINATYYRKLPYDTAKDFTAVALVAASPLVLAVHPSVPVRNVKEFVALAKARPQQLMYGTGGAGTTGHIAGEMFSAISGAPFVHVPYKGSGPAVQSVLGGEIAFTFSTTAAVIPLIASGRLRALGVTTAERIAGIDIPTIAESGFPNYEIVLYSGILGPAGLPAPVVNRLSGEVTRVLATPEVKQTYARLGAVPYTTTPAKFTAHLNSEIARLGAVVRASGTELQ